MGAGRGWASNRFGVGPARDGPGNLLAASPARSGFLLPAVDGGRWTLTRLSAWPPCQAWVLLLLRPGGWFRYKAGDCKPSGCLGKQRFSLLSSYPKTWEELRSALLGADWLHCDCYCHFLCFQVEVYGFRLYLKGALLLGRSVTY